MPSAAESAVATTLNEAVERTESEAEQAADNPAPEEPEAESALVPVKKAEARVVPTPVEKSVSQQVEDIEAELGELRLACSRQAAELDAQKTEISRLKAESCKLKADNAQIDGLKAENSKLKALHLLKGEQQMAEMAAGITESRERYDQAFLAYSDQVAELGTQKAELDRQKAEIRTLKAETIGFAENMLHLEEENTQLSERLRVKGEMLKEEVLRSADLAVEVERLRSLLPAGSGRSAAAISGMLEPSSMLAAAATEGSKGLESSSSLPTALGEATTDKESEKRREELQNAKAEHRQQAAEQQQR